MWTTRIATWWPKGHSASGAPDTRVVLDAMQVMPAFCYLLPCVLLFDIGYPPAVVATVIFALPAALAAVLRAVE